MKKQYSMKLKLKYRIPIKMKNPYFRLLLLFGVIFYFIISTNAAVPTLTIINNTYNNGTGSYGIFLNSGQSITFNVANISNVITWNWYVDKVLQSNNNSAFTTSFSSGSYHYVQVNATNINGTSNTLIWGVNVYPAMAVSSQKIQSLNESPANDLQTAISQKSFTGIIAAPIKIYTNLLGLGFYAFLWFLVFVMMWLKQQSINIPATVGIIFGGLLITFLPPAYQLISQVLIVFGIFAVIYVFFKGRG